MKGALTIVLFRLITSVVSEDAVESVSVLEGDSVTLKSGLTDMKTIESTEWRVNGSRITFGDIRHLDDQTGDLKISNIRTTDSGLYRLKISSTVKSSVKEFNVKVVSAAEVKPVPVTVMKGDSVTLLADLTGIQTYGEIQWRFGEKTFPVRSLTITDITAQDTGLYEADITSSSSSSRYIIYHIQSFNVTISDEVVSVSVLEEDTVTLLTGLTEIQTDDQILWKFGDHEVIAHLNSPDTKNWSNIDLNPQNRDLTIRNILKVQQGDYKVEINTRRMISHRKYRINFVTGAVEPVSVTEGDSATLPVTEIQNGDMMNWMFGGTLIAEMNKTAKRFLTSGTGRFIHRLQLDNQTGSLTIKHTTTTDSGEYELKISSSRYTIKRRNTVNVTGSGVSPGAVTGIVVGVVVLHLLLV